MTELPLPNLDEKPSPPKVPLTAGLPKLPNFSAPKLPTVPRPKVSIPTIPWRVILIGAVVTIGLGVAIFFLFFFKASATVQTTPADALIRLADQVATGTLTTKLAPGSYSLSVERQDFIPYTSTVALQTNDKQLFDIKLRALPEPLKLSEHIVQFMVLDTERTSLLYVEPGLKTAYRLFIKDLAKPVADEITPSTLERITDFIWSPNRELAFFKLGEETKQYDFKRYDLINQETHDWPAGVGSIDWRPDGEKVAYAFEPVGGERTIIRAAKDNSEQERIFNLVNTTITRPTLKWSPDAKYLSVVADKLYLLDVFAKELKPIEAAGPIKAALWLPTSTGLIVQGASDELSHISLEGVVTPLSITGSIGQVVPFADGQSVLYTQDRNSRTEFSRVSITGQAPVPYLFKAQAPLAPTNLILAEDEARLFFVSAGNPYSLLLDDGTY